MNALKSGILEQKSPAIQLELPLVGRQAELGKILRSVRDGNCCRVLGPRYQAKSKLLRQVAAILNRDGTHYTIYQSLWDVRLDSERHFLTDLYSIIERQCLLAGKATRGQVDLSSPWAFQDALTRLINQIDRNLALLIDDLEIGPPNLVAALLGALRAVFTTVVDRPGAHLQVIICGSLGLNQLALDSASRFESISDLVLIGDLNEQERLILARTLCQEAGLIATTKGIEALLKQTGGDYFLIEQISKICFDQMKQAGRVKMLPASIARAVETFLSPPLNWVVLEELRRLENNPSLLSCVLRTLEQGVVPYTQLPITTNETPTLLDLSGVFSRSGNSYKIRCELWSRLLRSHLTTDRVGGLYAIAGYWVEAIKYLGRAITKEHDEVKSELLATTINAMHASANTLQAFGFLAQGLQALYPENDLRLYYQRDRTLELVYPFDERKNRRHIPLGNIHSVEVEALHGPEYSIYSTSNGTRLFIPLRVSESTGSIGLLSLSNMAPQASLYQQREEVLQLANFSHQAARAIEAKSQFASLLNSTEQHIEKLDALNKVLTRILRHKDCAEEIILSMVLAGVTVGWGLGFNRAALFMPDESRQALVGRLGVGHLTQEQAKADWLSFPHQNLDDLLNYLLAGQGRETPLHKRVKDLVIPLRSTPDDVLGVTFYDGTPILSTQYSSPANLPQSFIEAIEPATEFALVPLSASEQALGVLYVDNKFTAQPIGEDHFGLLQTFINQTTLILQSIQALAAERRQTTILAKLLKVEEAVNDQITRSVKELLAEIVYSACQLIGADCAVIYPLLPDMGRGRYFYDAENIACVRTKQEVKPKEKPRSSGGMAAWVIQEGLIHIPNVETALPSPDGRRIVTSPFIAREEIRAFVGVRLGPREEPSGVLYINWRIPHSFSAEELALIEIYARFAAVAIPSARRYQQIQADLTRRIQELQGLNRVAYASLEFQSEEEIEKAIEQTLQAVKERTNVPYLYLFLDEPRGLWRSFQLLSSGRLLSKRKKMLPKGIARDAFIQRQSCLITDVIPRSSRNFSGLYHADSCCGLAVPVKVTGHCLAVLHLESSEPHSLTHEHQEYLEQLALRLAVTLEQADFSQALRRLLDISLQLTQETSLQSVLISLVEQAMDALRTVGAITLYYVERESGNLVLGHMAGVRDEAAVRKYPPHSGQVIGQVLRLDDPIFAEKVSENKLLNGAFVMREGIQSAAAFPLRVREERVGCLFFSYRFYHTFDKEERSLLNLFAQLAALAILRATLYAQAERRQQRLETVARITPTISASLELDEVFRAILREVKNTIPRTQNACIVQLDEKTQELIIPSVSLEFYHMDHSSLSDPYRVNITQEHSIAGRVIRTGQAEIISNTKADPDYLPLISSTQSELCVPIKIGNTTQGVLILESDQLNAFTLEDQRLLEMLADHVTIATQNAQRYALTRERELRERIAALAMGLIHAINSAVANIPDLVIEIEEKLKYGHDVSEPFSDLRKNAEETGRISSQLRDLVITKQFKPELIKLDTLIQRVILTLPKKREFKHIALRYKASSLAPEIMADLLWMEMLLQNLISNAYEAIPTDRSGVVEIEVETDQANVFIRVKDNGKGIAPEDRPRIFDPDYTTKEGGGRLHGIGLYHCRQFVAEHRGDLEVESTPGAGTMFTVVLPKLVS